MLTSLQPFDLKGPTSTLLSLLLAFQPLLYGCSSGDGGTGPGPQPDPVDTEQVSASVDLNEIGGDGLRVNSAWSSDNEVTEAGEVVMQASTEGAQLHWVVDGNGAPRGLSISIPSTNMGERSPVVFDAESTALSLIMLTPGILAVDPEEASTRVDEIQSLEEFQTLVGLLETHLPDMSLTETMALPGFNQAAESCISAWVEQAAEQNFTKLDRNDPTARFEATISDPSNPAATTVSLTNFAYRFLNIQRRILDSDLDELDVDTIHGNGRRCMSGATAASWGGIFWGGMYEPGLSQDIVDFSDDAYVVEYWILGPGSRVSDLEIPDSIDMTGIVEPWLFTHIWYVVFPILDVVFGVTGLFDDGIEAVWTAYDLIKEAADISEVLHADTSTELTVATFNLTIQLISMLATAGAISGALGVSATAWAIIATALTGGSIAIGTFNLFLVTESYLSLPRVARTVAIKPFHNGRIVFSSSRTGSHELFTMEDDGSSQNRLTYLSSSCLRPEWSLDGSRIVFESDGSTNRDIFIMNSDGSGIENLTNFGSSDRSPSLSPDGSKIAFESSRGGGWNIYVMDSNGSNVMRLTYNGGMGPDWSPDGQQIAYCPYGTPSGIFIMNSDGSNQVRITSDAIGSSNRPDWSWDGKRLVFTMYVEGNSDIYSVEVNGTNLTRLTYSEGSDDRPSWSPDGSKVVFESVRHGYPAEIYIMDEDGSNQTRITDELGFNGYPDWSSALLSQAN